MSGYKRLDEVELQPLAAELATAASVSYQMAHETARQLELAGEYQRASEIIAFSLAEEAQRINQLALVELDLSVHPLEFKGVMTRMAEQQSYFSELRMPSMYRRASTPVGVQRFLVCFHVAFSSVPEAFDMLPAPLNTLDALARRWQVSSVLVQRLWRDFIAASDGRFTLSLAKAHTSLLAGLPEEMHSKVWAFALMDAAANQLFAEGEGGAAGLNFEEYLVFRCFVSAKTLEEQFRFLWRLLDRDGDGKVGRADVLSALQLRRAQLGWDDTILSR